MVRAADLDEAVREAMAIAAAGDVLLLSPGAPSFGQFRNFEERGRLFKSLCRQYSADLTLSMFRSNWIGTCSISLCLVAF